MICNTSVLKRKSIIDFDAMRHLSITVQIDAFNLNVLEENLSTSMICTHEVQLICLWLLNGVRSPWSVSISNDLFLRTPC